MISHTETLLLGPPCPTAMPVLSVVDAFAATWIDVFYRQTSESKVSKAIP